MFLLIGAIIVVAAVGIIAGINDGEQNRPRPSASPRQAAGGALPAGNTPRPQPPGPTPPGKVWSPEHGHWHDANPAGASPIQVQSSQAPINVPAQPQLQPTTPQPQPPGAPPPGKVWSPEHGHWHDAPK
jgi:hypothetical protein